MSDRGAAAANLDAFLEDHYAAKISGTLIESKVFFEIVLLLFYNSHVY